MHTAANSSARDAAHAYRDGFEHLQDALGKLDALIKLRLGEFRRRMADSRGVPADPAIAISHGEVDRLLGGTRSYGRDRLETPEAVGRLHVLDLEIIERVRATNQQEVFLPLPVLARLFELSPLELEAVVVCLAPELDLKYDRVYAYLQDDITRKKPSVDLVLDLLCGRDDAERWNARALLSDEGRLFRAGILRATDDPQSPSGSSGLARFLKLDERILGFILGTDALDHRLGSLVRLYTAELFQRDWVPENVGGRALDLARAHLAAGSGGPGRLVFYVRGGYGAGGRDLALHVCSAIGCDLLYMDAETLASEPEPEGLLRLAFREALLRQCALYLDNAGALLRDDGRTHPLLKKLAAVIGEYGWLVFLGGEGPWMARGVFEGVAFQEVVLPPMDVPQAQVVWERALGDTAPEWAVDLSRRFKLAPGQVRDAVDAARNGAAMDGRQELALEDLRAACLAQSNRALGEMAVKTESRYGWDDLVLPDEPAGQLRELCAQVRHGYRVFGEWGFGRKVGYGRGLSALFSGPSGTGKTMAAQVIARELSLDLYRVDISGVVSKYIGETEKNLSRIFREAESSNAILFFDEADALFGKRTEIADAHDRYANIETSYLLQKMEEYEGVVILATNLQENMDDAFVRRVRFIVEFPFPDAAHRLRIWKSHFPPEAPTGEIDFEYLAREFAIAGGGIRNVVLSAAFSAADAGESIDMRHILHGVRREYGKMGKVWSEPKPVRSTR